MPNLEIKPCPFCGFSEFDLELGRSFTMNIDRNHILRVFKEKWVICLRCKTKGPIQENLKEAIEAWNERK